MTIGSISSVGSYGSTINGSKNIRELERQITELKKAISDLQNDDSIDEKTKSQQLTQYQSQILLLQTQIQQARQEKNEQPEPAQETDPEYQSMIQEKNDERAGLGQLLDEEA